MTRKRNRRERGKTCLIYKFRANTKHKARKGSSEMEQSDTFLIEPHHEVFTINKLPELPVQSEELRGILEEFSGTSIETNYPVVTQSRKPTFKKINGFIAFRSFYTKSIKNAIYQRRLSQRLGKAWLADPNKETWDRYAQEYNATALDCNINFVEWLSLELKLHAKDKAKTIITSTVKNSNWGFTSGNSSNIVEDVFLVQ